MRKYENVALFKNFIPTTNNDKGFIDNYQGMGVIGLYLDYIEGKPETITYYLDMMLGWNVIDNIALHDTEDHTACPVNGMRLFRNKLASIRSHVRRSIKLCKTDGAVEYIRRVADIGAPSTAYVTFHRSDKGSVSWCLSDCRDKARYCRSSNELMLVFLEQLSSAMDLILKEYDRFVRHVLNTIPKDYSHT